VPDLQLGGLHLRQYDVAVLDLSTINYAYRQLAIDPVIGVIGGDILVKYGGIIDYRTQLLRLRSRRLRKTTITPIGKL